jgi:uncharacterized protein (TIGR03118 family)
MRLLAFCRKQISYRPVLECLEDRCLLASGFGLVPLASDLPGLSGVTVPQLINPWGISFSPTGPFWFSSNGSGVSNVLDGTGQLSPLVVTVPSGAPWWAASPTGTVFNGGAGFAIAENGVAGPSRFLFATQAGTIAAWNTDVDPTHALLVVDDSASGAAFTGLALAGSPTGSSFLYAADFGRGTIDVFDQSFQPVARSGAFQDPNLPAGYAPFNVQSLGNLLFVTYTQKDWSGNNVAGAGSGVIDVFDTGGNLVRRFASGGALNSPWGLTLAPAQFGPFGGDLLVGNNGDGRINAYDPSSGKFLGQLGDDTGTPLVVPELWALTFGNGHAAGDANTLFFAAGLGGEAHGLFGAIQAPDRRGAETAGTGAYILDAPGELDVYPLPPGGGPALRAASTSQPFLTADLVPLTDSSLALVPTLTALTGPTAISETPGGDLSLGSPVLIAGRSSLATETSPPGLAARQDAIALDAFLDVNSVRVVSPNPVGMQGTGLYALADRPAAVDGLLTLAPASEDQSSGVLPPSGQITQDVVAVASDSRADSAEEHAEAGQRGGWTKVVNIFLAVSIPVLGTYWVSQVWSRQATQGNLLSRSGNRRRLTVEGH